MAEVSSGAKRGPQEGPPILLASHAAEECSEESELKDRRAARTSNKPPKIAQNWENMSSGFDLKHLVLIAGMAAPIVPANAQTAGVTGNEILLGSSVDLTAPIAAIGVPMKAGFEIASEMINESGYLRS